MKDRIRKIRRDLDLTQQEFADRLGIKRGTIANYELGRNEPVDSVISLICREFNVSEEWLRNGIGEIFNPEPRDELDSLADKFNLSHGEYIFLEKYLKLNVKNGTMSLNSLWMCALQSETPAFLVPPSPLQDLRFRTLISMRKSKYTGGSWRLRKKRGENHLP